MKTASQILAEHRITLRTYREGVNVLGRCPKCSAARKKHNLACLSVKILSDGVVWKCHHCGDEGGEYFETGKDFRASWPSPRIKSGGRPGARSYAQLQRAAAAGWAAAERRTRP
jgi:hypothetical protein